MTVRPPAEPLSYGNLYSKLLDYVVFAVLIFYVLTIAGIFVLRRTRPDAERPYRAFGYPIAARTLHRRRRDIILLCSPFIRAQTTWPGLLIVLAGVPVYFLWKNQRDREDRACATVDSPSRTGTNT